MSADLANAPSEAANKAASAPGPSIVLGLLKAARVQQWVKNLLIFIPLMVSHQYGQIELWRLSVLGLLGFGLCASAMYVFNDLLDVEADRAHPVKRHRPFASGVVSPSVGGVLSIALLVIGLWVGSLVSPSFFRVALAYTFLSSVYSLYLKKLLLVDVFVIGLLYLMRLLAGCVAIGVPLSFWLADFSMFAFLSLVLAKRYVEVARRPEIAGPSINRRDYQPQDAPQIAIAGIVCGCIAPVFLAFYINSDDVIRLYGHPERLWPISMAFLYWISRLWMLAGRGKLASDPLLFVVTDWSSYVTIAFVAGAFFLAI